MSYQYTELRPKMFTEEGQLRVLGVVRKARECIECSGAVLAERLLSAAGSGNTWEMMAAVDRLVELKMLRDITVGLAVAWQERVFIAGSVPL